MCVCILTVCGRHLPGFSGPAFESDNVHSSVVACLLVNSFGPAAAADPSSVHLGVEFVLEDVQVVGGGDGDDVLVGVPGRVQDLLGEVQAVHADVVLPPFPAGGADPPWLQDGSGFAALPRGLQGHISLGVAVKHSEKVVVGAGHNHTGQNKNRKFIIFFFTSSSFETPE